MCPPPESGEDSVSPVIGSDIKATEHLRSCDSLRVHPHLLVWFAAVCHGLHQHSDALRLAGSRRTEGHHAVTYTLGLVQLDQLQHPGSVVYQAELTHLSTQHLPITHQPHTPSNGHKCIYVVY